MGKSRELSEYLSRKTADLHRMGSLLETFLNKCKFQDHQFKQVIQMQFAEV